MEEPQLITREIRHADSLAVSQLISELGYPTTNDEMQVRFNHIINHSDYKTFVASLNGIVVGMAGATQNYAYEQNGKYARIVAFVITQQYRKRGVGSALLKTIESWAKETGCTSILLNCGNRQERKEAHAFYQQRGYVVKSSGYTKKL